MYKKLNINRDKIINTVNMFLSSSYLNSKCEDSLIHISNSQYRLNYMIKKESGIIDFYFNKNGTTTISPNVGKFRSLNVDLAEIIKSECVMDDAKSKSYVLNNVDENDLSCILQLISELDIIVEKISNIDSIIKSRYKLTGKNDNQVSLSYYKSGTLLLQGKPISTFFKCITVISELIDSDKTNSAFNDFYEVNIEQKNVIRLTEIHMPNAYNLLPANLLNGVYQSVYLTLIESNTMFDYTCIAFPAYRVLEGFLKYFLKTDFKIIIDTRYDDKKLHNFFKDNGDSWHTVNDKEIPIHTDKANKLAELYVIYKNRHPLFHMEDLGVYEISIPSKEIENMQAAKQIIIDILNEIDVYYSIEGEQ